jgi:ribosomal protein L32
MRTIFQTISVLAIVLILIGSHVDPALGQTPVQLEQLHIDLWPEFDQPAMLVIYQGSLPADTPLPATLQLRIPARVAGPHAVAYSDESGNLLQTNYSTERTGEWLVITLETPERNFQLEYYDSLSQSGDRRDYTFEWPGDYAVGQLTFTLLPPARAKEVKTEPTLAPIQRGTDSFSYEGSLDGLTQGDTRELTISYVGTEVIAPVSDTLSIDQGGINLQFLIGIGLIVAAVVLAVFWFVVRPRLGSNQELATPNRSVASQRRRAQRSKPSRASASATFCTKCGHPLRGEDRFCSQCGAPVKRRTGPLQQK